MRSADLDARLAERALRERWPVPPEKLPGLVQVLLDLAESPATKPRERISAIKALIGASRHNLAALEAGMKAEEFGLYLARLRALGGEAKSDGDG